MVAVPERFGPLPPEEWFDVGWMRFLPVEGLFLAALIGGATVARRSGGLNALAASAPWFAFRGRGLEAPLTWDHSDIDDDAEQRALDSQRRLQFAESCAARGLAMPETVRQLAHVMAALGIFEHNHDGWRVARPMPLPTEALTLAPENVADEDARRWRAANANASQAILQHLLSAHGKPSRMPTTITALAGTLGRSVEGTRFGLAVLAAEGDIHVLGRSETAVDVEVLGAVEPVTITVD
jgi:hypothetical protein